MLLQCNTRAGTTKTNARAQTARGHHGVPCEKAVPANPAVTQVNVPMRSPRDRGELILEGLNRRNDEQQQEAEAAQASFSAISRQGWPAGSLPTGTSPDSLLCSHLPRLKPMVTISPSSTFLANQHCQSVPSTTSGEE